METSRETEKSTRSLQKLKQNHVVKLEEFFESIIKKLTEVSGSITKLEKVLPKTNSENERAQLTTENTQPAFENTQN